MDEIDKLIPLQDKAKTTIGQRVAAMILNGQGFVDDRLYLLPKFLENKPVSRLLGCIPESSSYIKCTKD